MTRALAASCIVVLAFCAPAWAQDAGCSKDTDCKGERICVEKVCVDPPTKRACTRDLDCSGEDVCEKHVCAAPAKKKTKAGGHRDLIKEAARDAEARRAAAAAETKAADAPIPAWTPAAPVAAAPSAAATNPAAPVGPPAPPPELIVAPTPAPPVAPPPPAPAPVAVPAPAHAAAPLPAPPTAAKPNELPLPPLEPITPPPPLVAAPLVPVADVSTGSSFGTPIYGAGLTLGMVTWFSSGGQFDIGRLNAGSEPDFEMHLSGEGGIRLTRHLGIELLVHGSWSPMVAGRTGLYGGIGPGLRVDHLGPVPGQFTLGGTYTAGAISASNLPSIDFSGGSLLLEYTVPVVGRFGVQGQLGAHFVSYGLTLFTLSAGVAFGN